MAADKVPPKKPTNWGRVSKTLSFWILIILIPVAFFQLSGAAREPSAQIDWTRFQQELGRNNVATVTIRPWPCRACTALRTILRKAWMICSMSATIGGRLTS